MVNLILCGYLKENKQTNKKIVRASVLKKPPQIIEQVFSNSNCTEWSLIRFEFGWAVWCSKVAKEFLPNGDHDTLKDYQLFYKNKFFSINCAHFKILNLMFLKMQV